MNKSAPAAYVDKEATWDSFNLDPRLLQALDHLGFKNPTLVQSSAIPLALEDKRDIIAKSSTGSGKTGAYCIPIVQTILSSPSAFKCVKAVVLVPTKELSAQVSQFLEKILIYCNQQVSVVNLSSGVSDSVLQSMLAGVPDILVSTPFKLIQTLKDNVASTVLDVARLHSLVIDEVDLVLSYGNMDDLQELESFLPVKSNLQTYLMSATVSEDLESLKKRFCTRPAVLQLNEDALERSKLVQYYARTTEFDKFLLTYVIFKLQLIQGKTLVFVNSVNRGYRLKLFLEQFGVRCCILNSELPVNSRMHIVNEFNKNVYSLLIATDESNERGRYEEDMDVPEPAGAAVPDKKETDQKKPSKKASKSKRDGEYGVSRGIDFLNVSCVLNFDMPSTARSYTHRVGRTARAGKAGMALSFILPVKEVGKHKVASIEGPQSDEKVLQRVEKQQAKRGMELKPYQFNMKQVDGFRYRAQDAFGAVTANAIREARVCELRKELLNSDKLKRFFEENPQDLATLRHDKELYPSNRQKHLAHVPEYLLPESVRSQTMDLRTVPFKNRVFKKRERSKNLDPLKKSFRKR